jgi:hypothetical protein
LTCPFSLKKFADDTHKEALVQAQEMGVEDCLRSSCHSIWLSGRGHDGAAGTQGDLVGANGHVVPGLMQF